MTTTANTMSIAYMEKLAKQLSKTDATAAINLKRLWENAKAERPQLTQEAAALDMGMTQGAINQYLNGKIPLNVEVTLKFSKLLNVSPLAIRPDLGELLHTLILTKDDFLTRMASDLPPQVTRDILEHILFKIQRADEHLAKDKLAHYLVTINKMLNHVGKQRPDYEK